MWLFGGATAQDGGGQEAQGEEASEEVLRAEAEELRLKLEAMQAADYREQQRQGCEATAQGQQGGATADGCAAAADGSVLHFRMDISTPEEAELEAMYDFAGFAPDHAAGCSAGRAGLEAADGGPGRPASAVEAAAARRVRLVEAKLQERETALEMQMEEKERKLNAASRALHRTRGQLQQLNAQLGLKDIEGSRLQCQVSQLRNLLVEKERRLQEALDEREGSSAASAGAARHAHASSQSPSEQADEGSASGDTGSEGEGAAPEERAQQPQEPPTACAQAPADDEQLLQMSRIAEDLTEALEVAREGEEEARRQLAETAARLQAEKAAREDLAEAQRRRDAEVAALRAQVEQQQRDMQAMAERNSRAFIEERLQQALAQKGKSQWYPHLEV